MFKDSRKDSDKDRHTPILEDGSDTLQRVEIITGTGRRRRWSSDAKAACNLPEASKVSVIQGPRAEG